MNNLVSVILSLAILAVSIPSAMSQASCTSDTQCLDLSGGTQCCVEDVFSREETCQTVDQAALSTTFEELRTLPGAGFLVDALHPTIVSLANGLPLNLTAPLCSTYAQAQKFVAQGGLFGK